MSTTLKVVNCPSQVRAPRARSSCCTAAQHRRLRARARTWRSATASSAMPWTRRRWRRTSRCLACAPPRLPARRSCRALPAFARSPNIQACPPCAPRCAHAACTRWRHTPASSRSALRSTPSSAGCGARSSARRIQACPHAACAHAHRPQLARVSAGDNLRVDDFAVPRKQFELALLTIELEFVKSRGPGAPQEEVDAPSLVKQLLKRFQQQARPAAQAARHEASAATLRLTFCACCAAGVHGGPEADV
jgi:hypothetical protein